MKTYESYEVCRTGKLNQFYTLYVFRTVVSGTFALETRRFMQNLSIDERQAWKKGVAIYTERKETFSDLIGDYSASIDMIDSPRRLYCDLKAFGMDWRKTEKGFCTEPTQEFWQMWRQYKTILKEAGFSVFKGDTGSFILFFRNTTDEKMQEAFKILDDKKANQVTTGNYVGELKQRLKNIKVIVKSVFCSSGYYGDSQCATFEDEEGNTYKTFYSGDSKIIKGEFYSLTGTVKKHEERDGVRQTVLNRIKF